MDNKVILVTGGSRGIGAETAILAARQGWHVVITYRNDENAANKVIKEITNLGQKALAIKADIANEKDIYQLFTPLITHSINSTR